jgi:hypothetical protein
VAVCPYRRAARVRFTMPVTNTEHTDTLPTRRDRRHTIHENIHARESWKLLEPPVCASRFGALPEHPSVQPGSVRAAMISPRCLDITLQRTQLSKPPTSLPLLSTTSQPSAPSSLILALSRVHHGHCHIAFNCDAKQPNGACGTHAAARTTHALAQPLLA